MDLINFINLTLYLSIGILSIVLWKKGEVVCAIALGTLSIHGLLFNGIYIFRDVTWVACPPMCGLQEWSAALRLHGLLAIVTAMMYRILVAS